MALSLPSRRVACISKSASLSCKTCVPHLRTPASVKPYVVQRSRVSLKAAGQEEGFDSLLNTFAEKFEKVENKPVVVGYVVAAVSALIIAEWLIHLPALDVVLGFPIQLLGVVMAPVLVVRYLLDKKDVTADIIDTVTDVSKRLPGLDK